MMGIRTGGRAERARRDGRTGVLSAGNVLVRTGTGLGVFWGGVIQPTTTTRFALVLRQISLEIQGGGYRTPPVIYFSLCIRHTHDERRQATADDSVLGDGD